MLKKVIIFFGRILRWFYHNLFLRLWLVFGGIIGISTTSTCPCCGQAASACPTGFSIIAISGGILAGIGVFYKQIEKFFRNIFKKNASETPCAEKRSRKWPFGWVLFSLTVIATMVLGNYFSISAAPQNTWQPAQRTANMCSLKSKTSPAHAGFASQASEKNCPIPTVPEKNAEQESAERSSKLSRMRAVIKEDGSVVIQKEEPDVIRYETAGFLELNDDIYDRLDFYEGKKAEITGYVYRRSDFQSTQFAVARGYIRCCLACGAVPVGPLCEWDHAPGLANDIWVKVEGIIARGHFKDTYYEESSDIPVIKVEKVERVPKLKSPYVYSRNSEMLSNKSA